MQFLNPLYINLSCSKTQPAICFDFNFNNRPDVLYKAEYVEPQKKSNA